MTTTKPAGEHIIHRHYITLKSGHTISIFFNETSGLFCCDVNHKNGRGGNEFIRKTIEPSKMVAFCAKLPPIEEDEE